MPEKIERTDDEWRELLSPEQGVSPGQACVFYAPEGSRVLGGGWIWKGR